MAAKASARGPAGTWGWPCASACHGPRAGGRAPSQPAADRVRGPSAPSLGIRPKGVVSGGGRFPGRLRQLCGLNGNIIDKRFYSVALWRFCFSWLVVPVSREAAWAAEPRHPWPSARHAWRARWFRSGGSGPARSVHVHPAASGPRRTEMHLVFGASGCSAGLAGPGEVRALGRCGPRGGAGRLVPCPAGAARRSPERRPQHR